MSRAQKTLTICLWGATVLIMVGVIALWPREPDARGGQTALTPNGVVYSNGTSGDATPGNDATPGSGGPGNSAAALPIMWRAPKFSLTDQDNKTITLADLRGRPFICDFIYTHCPGVCPVMTATLAHMQTQLSPAVRMVSFTVDPGNDTPAVLKKYATEAGAQPGRWFFLTGKPSQIFDVGFGMRVVAPNTTVSPLDHNSHFFLVDAAGNVREMGDVSYPSEIDTMVRDANALAAASPAGTASPASAISPTGVTSPAGAGSVQP